MAGYVQVVTGTYVEYPSKGALALKRMLEVKKQGSNVFAPGTLLIAFRHGFTSEDPGRRLPSLTYRDACNAVLSGTQGLICRSGEIT